MLPWEERGLAAGLAAEKSSGAHGPQSIRAGLRPGCGQGAAGPACCHAPRACGRAGRGVQGTLRSLVSPANKFSNKHGWRKWVLKC